MQTKMRPWTSVRVVQGERACGELFICSDAAAGRSNKVVCFAIGERPTSLQYCLRARADGLPITDSRRRGGEDGCNIDQSTLLALFPPGCLR